MSTATAEPPDAPETADTPDIPATERKAINNMADKFKAAMAQAAIAPATVPTKPVEKPKPAEQPKPAAPAEKPAQPATPPTTPEKPAPASKPEEENLSRKNYKALEESRDKYKAEVEALKTAATERDQLKAELESARKGSVEYEEAKKKLAEKDQAISERDQFIKQFYIEHSPEFQSHFGQRLQNAVVEAKEAVGQEHAAQVEAAFQVPPSTYRDQQVAALAESLPDFQKAALVAAYTDLKRTERERAAELKKAPENFKKLQELNEQRAKEAQAQEAAKRDALTTMVMSRVESELKDADESTAKVVKDRTRKIIEWSASPEELSNTLVDAARATANDNRIKEYIEKVQKLEAQLAELQGAQPGVQTSAAAPASRKQPINPDDHTDIGVKFRKLRDELPARHRKTGEV